MNKPLYIQNLKTVVTKLENARKHLQTSFNRCKKIKGSPSTNEDHLIELEAITARFARVVDMLIHKFFRSIDIVELSDGGTLIDVVNRAEKRGLIHSALEIRALKDLRNEISHEYAIEALPQLQQQVYESIPGLFNIIDSCLSYAKKYLKDDS